MRKLAAYGENGRRVGETHHNATIPEAIVQEIRELHEELGCQAEIVRALPSFRHDYPALTIEMFPFVCRLAATSPAPRALEHAALRWVLPHELPTLDLAAADFPVLASYQT